MKKQVLLRIYFALIIAAFSVVSCADYLDQAPTTLTTVEMIYATRAQVMNNLATVYAAMPADFEDRWPADWGGNLNTSGVWNSAAGEIEMVWTDFGQRNRVSNGTLTPETGIVSRYWTRWYRGIRAATQFIQNIELCNDLWPGDKEQWVAEARAVRAIYYFFLLRTYGPVPIIEGSLSEQTRTFNQTRSPVQDVVEYIHSELEWAINNGLLANIKMQIGGAVTSLDKGLGHIDQPIARAYQVQVRMYAASPLYNGSVPFVAGLQNNDGTRLFPTYTDVQKQQLWATAATEAKRFIDTYVGNGYDLTRIYTDGVLDPYMSYREAVRGDHAQLTDFSGRSSAIEMIWFSGRGNASIRGFNRTPKHSGGDIFGNTASAEQSGGGAEGPSQMMVDAYFMANGMKPVLGYESDRLTPIINPDAGYSEVGFSTEPYLCPATGRELAPANIFNAWVGREARFYADVTFDGQRWLHDHAGTRIVYTGMQANGNSGRWTGSVNDYSFTGYLVRKGVHLGNWNIAGGRVSIMLRLAQIYLDYAEALHESNPGHADILIYLNLVRERAGLPRYGIDMPVPEDIRQAIRDERKVELSYEHIHYFDIRRWGILEQQNDLMSGMNLLGNGDDFFVRTPVRYVTRQPRSYFLPIPFNETLVNRSLVQNQGW